MCTSKCFEHWAMCIQICHEENTATIHAYTRSKQQHHRWSYIDTWLSNLKGSLNMKQVVSLWAFRSSHAMKKNYLNGGQGNEFIGWWNKWVWGDWMRNGLDGIVLGGWSMEDEVVYDRQPCMHETPCTWQDRRQAGDERMIQRVTESGEGKWIQW